MNAERKTTRVTVCSQEQYDRGPFYFGESYKAGSLNRVIASLEAIRDSIPPEFRDDARCEIDSTGGYEGSNYASILVVYDRPETDAEKAAREQRYMEHLNEA